MLLLAIEGSNIMHIEQKQGELLWRFYAASHGGEEPVSWPLRLQHIGGPDLVQRKDGRGGESMSSAGTTALCVSRPESAVRSIKV